MASCARQQAPHPPAEEDEADYAKVIGRSSSTGPTLMRKRQAPRPVMAAARQSLIVRRCWARAPIPINLGWGQSSTA